MRIRSSFIGVGIWVCTGILSAQHRAADHPAGPQARSTVLAGQAAKASASECLGCHGPFSKIVEASAGYVAPSGEKTSPHRYVPHDSKKDADIPDCTHCHTAHPLDPLPAKGSIDVSKVTVQWCYEACHHEKDLTSCKKCHP